MHSPSQPAEAPGVTDDEPAAAGARIELEPASSSGGPVVDADVDFLCGLADKAAELKGKLKAAGLKAAELKAAGPQVPLLFFWEWFMGGSAPSKCCQDVLNP